MKDKIPKKKNQEMEKNISKKKKLRKLENMANMALSVFSSPTFSPLREN